MDSGASQHYLKTTHSKLLIDRTIKNGPSVNLPNNQSLQVTEQGNLNLHKNLPYEASRAYILPNLLNESLLSVGQSCDYNCTVLFDKYFCDIRHKNKLILKGKRNFNDGLYDVPLTSHNNLNSSTSNNNNLQINYVTKHDKTKLEMAQFLHAALFSPCIKTLQQAIYNGNLISWPIESLNFNKLIKTTTATEKGHLDQERKYLHPTTPRANHNSEDFPSKINERTNNLFLNIIHPLTQQSSVLKQKSYMDLTGRFPHKSSRGNEYLFVLYNYDTNAILFEPLKNRQAKEITQAFNKCISKLSKNLLLPKLYVMDNECSADLKLAIIKNKGSYELVPPHQHRRNSVEKAIRTLKNHLLSGLATCDENYHIHEWDRILPQCDAK